MRAFFRRLKVRLDAWLECRRHLCSYYQHYLVYGPADLTHEGFHNAERKAMEHFRNCRYQGRGLRDDGKLDLCPSCSAWERRVRA